MLLRLDSRRFLRVCNHSRWHGGGPAPHRSFIYNTSTLGDITGVWNQILQARERGQMTGGPDGDCFVGSIYHFLSSGGPNPAHRTDLQARRAALGKQLTLERSALMFCWLSEWGFPPMKTAGLRGYGVHSALQKLLEAGLLREAAIFVHAFVPLIRESDATPEYLVHTMNHLVSAGLPLSALRVFDTFMLRQSSKTARRLLPTLLALVRWRRRGTA
jgi:hypothetical protein